MITYQAQGSALQLPYTFVQTGHVLNLFLDSEDYYYSFDNNYYYSYFHIIMHIRRHTRHSKMHARHDNDVDG